MRRVSTTIRSFVSKRKIRYREADYNLDLTYITTRVIAMGFPSESLEGLYRNPMKEVQRFFKEKHSGHYKMYNLCQERSYPAERFENVACYPFRDHKCPKFQMVLDFCQDAAAFIRADPQNVVAIHCKAGKGRTGMFICCLLIFMKTCPSADTALQLYANLRTQDASGVSIPSQRRWVYYFEEYLRVYFPVKQPLPVISVNLRMIRFSSIPSFGMGGGCEPYFKIKNVDDDTIYSWKKSMRAHIKNFKGVGGLEFRLDGKGVELKGEIEITFFDKDPLKKDKKMFWLWINTAFVGPEGVLMFPRGALDGAVKDKKFKHFSPDFKIQLFFANAAEVAELKDRSTQDPCVLLPPTSTSSAPTAATPVPHASSAPTSPEISDRGLTPVTSKSDFVERDNWHHKRRHSERAPLRSATTQGSASMGNTTTAGSNNNNNKVTVVKTGAMTIGGANVVGSDHLHSSTNGKKGAPTHMHSLSTSGLEMHSSLMNPEFKSLSPSPSSSQLSQSGSGSTISQSMNAAATLGYSSLYIRPGMSLSTTSGGSNAQMSLSSVNGSSMNGLTDNHSSTLTSANQNSNTPTSPNGTNGAMSPPGPNRVSISADPIVTTASRVPTLLTIDEPIDGVGSGSSSIKEEHADTLTALAPPVVVTTGRVTPRIARESSFVSYSPLVSSSSSSNSSSLSSLPTTVDPLAPSPRGSTPVRGSVLAPSPRNTAAPPLQQSQSLSNLKQPSGSVSPAGGQNNRFSFTSRLLNRSPSPSPVPPSPSSRKAPDDRRNSSEPYKLADILKQMSDEKKDEEIKSAAAAAAAAANPPPLLRKSSKDKPGSRKSSQSDLNVAGVLTGSSESSTRTLTRRDSGAIEV